MCVASIYDGKLNVILLYVSDICSKYLCKERGLLLASNLQLNISHVLNYGFIGLLITVICPGVKLYQTNVPTNVPKLLTAVTSRFAHLTTVNTKIT